MKLKYISIILLFAFSLTACSDWLKEEDASKLIYDFYATEQGIDAALVATYSYMRWGAGNKARFNMMTKMGVDLMTEARDGKTRESFNRYKSGFMNPSLKVLYDFWENHYKAISTANIAIAQVKKSAELTEAKRNQNKNTQVGSREWGRMRLGETYLIAVEAA